MQMKLCSAGPTLVSPHETRDTLAPAETSALLTRSVRASAGLRKHGTPPLAPTPPELSFNQFQRLYVSGRQAEPGPGDGPRLQPAPPWALCSACGLVSGSRWR